MSTVADAYVRVRPDTTKFGGELTSKVEKDAADAGTKAGKAFGGSFAPSATSMLKSAAGLVGGLLIGKGVLDLGKMGLQAAADMQQATVGFQTMLGSAKAANQFLADLKTFAAKTPFELPGLVDTSRLLLGVGVAAKDVIPMLTAWGDAAGAMGISGERFNAAMLAVSQSLGAGRINAGDMNQIINAGIPIWKLMSEATGKPVAELKKLSETGKLLSADILPKVQAQMEKDYGGAMAAQSNTLAGVWSTLMDTLRIGMSDTLTPLIPLLSKAVPAAAGLLSKGLSIVSGVVTKDVLPAITNGLIPAGKDVIEGFQKGHATTDGFAGKMESLGVVLHNTWNFVRNDVVPVAKDFVGALKDTVSAVVDTVSWFNKHRDTTYTLIGVITALVLITKAHAAAMAVEAAGGILKYVASVNVVQGAIKVWTALQWLLNLAMDANPIGLIIVGIAALVAVIVLVATKTRFFQTVWADVWGFLKAVGAWFAGPFVNFFVGAWHFIENTATAARNTMIGVFHTIINVAMGVFDSLLGAAVKAFGWVPGLGDKLKAAKREFDSFRQGVNAALDEITRNVTVTIATRVTGPAGVAIVTGVGFNTTGKIKGFASGGVAPSDEWVRFNERGMEWMNPATRQILPVGQEPPRQGSDGAAVRIDNFYATPEQSPRSIAEELAWLAKARGRP